MPGNPLFLPELREMLAEKDVEQMKEFCSELHPARAAEFLEGLAIREIWEILRHCEVELRAEIFSYFDIDIQVAILDDAPREEMGELVDSLPSDDRVDILQELDRATADEIVALLPSETRRDILRLQAFPEGTCGSLMSTDFVRLSETMSVDQAIQAIGKQAGVLETVYYLYVLDESDHLVGLVSAKQLLGAVGTGETLIHDLMERDLITVEAMETSQEAAEAIAKYDFLAVPVVDDEHRMLGIVTYDDVIDLNSEEATKHAYQMGAISPMEESYLEAPFFTIWQKRVFWLSCLFIAELCTFSVLAVFEAEMAQYLVLALFIPLCISTGGNSGAQAATLITRSLAVGDVKLGDWLRVVRHELLMGLALGFSLGVIGFLRAACTPESLLGAADRWLLALVIGQSVAMICLFGTLIGALLPLLFKRIGVDPAIASSPFVATFVDVTGIVVFFSVAKLWLLSGAAALAPMVMLDAVSIEFSLAEPTAEARETVQDECYRTLSQQKEFRVFYVTDQPQLSLQAETVVSPLSEESRFQIGCTIVFKDKPSYDRFVASRELTEFLQTTSHPWQDRRVVFFKVRMPAEATR